MRWKLWLHDCWCVLILSSVPWLVNMCAVNRSHVCHYSFTCMPWLVRRRIRRWWRPTAQLWICSLNKLKWLITFFSTRLVCEWIVSHVWIRHGTYVNESWRIYHSAKQVEVKWLIVISWTSHGYQNMTSPWSLRSLSRVTLSCISEISQSQLDLRVMWLDRHVTLSHVTVSDLTDMLVWVMWPDSYTWDCTVTSWMESHVIWETCYFESCDAELWTWEFTVTTWLESHVTWQTFDFESCDC